MQPIFRRCETNGRKVIFLHTREGLSARTAKSALRAGATQRDSVPMGDIAILGRIVAWKGDASYPGDRIVS